MIGIIDYGCGNVGSVQNMFSKIGIWSEKIAKPEILTDYSGIVLPGVGAFDTGARRLKSTGFWDALKQFVEVDQKPILGICLGMQLFFEGSDEGSEAGFGWLPGNVQKFSASESLRIPHMSWNAVDFKSPRYTDLTANNFYFVHAYHAPANLDPMYVLGTTLYGEMFPSAVEHNNITGFQFHPEKSLVYGMELLKRWNLIHLEK